VTSVAIIGSCAGLARSVGRRPDTPTPIDQERATPSSGLGSASASLTSSPALVVARPESVSSSTRAGARPKSSAGTRSDPPIVLPLAKAQKMDATKTAVSEDAWNGAAAALERDRFSNSTRSSNDAKRHRLEAEHLAWSGPSSPREPLWPDSVMAAGARQEAGRDSSGTNSRSTVRVLSRDTGPSWLAAELRRPEHCGVNPHTEEMEALKATVSRLEALKATVSTSGRSLHTEETEVMKATVSSLVKILDERENVRTPEALKETQAAGEDEPGNLEEPLKTKAGRAPFDWAGVTKRSNPEFDRHAPSNRGRGDVVYGSLWKYPLWTTPRAQGEGLADRERQ
jgi:hypothetical protein